MTQKISLDLVKKLDEKKTRMLEAHTKWAQEIAKAVSVLEEPLNNLLGNMQDLNTKFPETQRFLKHMGVSHVRELDKQGLIKLEWYLKKILEKLQSPKEDED